jgi:putative membrane protein
MWHYQTYFWGMHWIWWLLWFILLYRVFFSPWARKEDPLDTLKRKLVKGEIDIPEYEEKKALLKKV